MILILCAAVFLFSTITCQARLVTSKSNSLEDDFIIQNQILTASRYPRQAPTLQTVAPSINDTCGQWQGNQSPWLVSIYHHDQKTDDDADSLKYICSGTLINSRQIITSAQCLCGYNLKCKRAEDLIIIFGKDNLKISESISKQEQTINGQEIFKHPDYNSSADADIAIISLKQPIAVQPICLWNESSDLRLVENLEGTTASWNLKQGGRLESIQMTIVSQEQCLRSNPAFLHVTSTRTFCAGQPNGSAGPCVGDSGIGLSLKRNDRWYLRGFISASLVKDGGCDQSSYIVFTDVAKYTDWILHHSQ